MGPKKEKDVAVLVGAFVARPYEEQVDLLAQALLREFMHKRQYRDTLVMFDEECPRDEHTISSRALMAELMMISPERTALLKTEGIETIMEMLCKMRVDKATTVEQRWAELHQILDTKPAEVPQSYFDELSALEEEIRKTKKRIKKEKKLARKLKEEGVSPKRGAAADRGSEKKKKVKGKKDIEGLLTIDQLLDQDDSEKIEHIRQKQQGSKKSPVRSVGSKPDTHASEQLPGQDVHETPKRSKRAVGSDSDSNSSGGSSAGSRSDSDSDAGGAEDEDDYAASLRKIKEEEKLALHRRENSSSSRQGWNEGLDEVAASPPRVLSTMSPIASPPKGLSTVPTALPSAHDGSADHAHETLGNALAEELKRSLVGADRRIPSSFWNQGFYFSEHVAYGLLQNEGGCCGVLAVVQALLLTDIFGEHRMLTESVKHNALVKAFTSILTRIEPDTRRIVVVQAPSHHHHTTVNRAKTIREQVQFLSNLKKTTNFHSISDIDACMGSEVLKHWMEPDGHGLLCWMLSCILTRGVQRVQRDMDVESPLIVEHGYCSQELVNLMMSGCATSNVHDGEIQHGEDLVLRGFPSPLPVGFLSYMEHRKLLTVGGYGKSPTFPVWVINHESHYTTLFMKADRRADIQQGLVRGFTPNVAFDVFFWDQLGGQGEEIRLTVTLEATAPPMPLGRDVIVPYLNDIIRTVPEWSTARVSWNGTDPLL